MFQNTHESLQKPAKERPYVIVYRELLADTISPIAAFECLVPANTHAMLLESGFKFRESGSYSFIGYQPYATFTSKNGTTVITTPKGSETHTESPLELLREFHQHYHSTGDEAAKLAGHMMGFLAYDAIRYFEEIPDRHRDDEAIPDILFHFYRINVVFDHDSGKLLIVVVADIDSHEEAAYQEAHQQLQEILTQLQNYSPSVTLAMQYTHRQNHLNFQTDCEDDEFKSKVNQAKQFIRAGDAFQIVLSRTFSTPVSAEPLSIYRILRQSNPTPYMFYFTTPEFIAFGASPEKLVSLHEHQVTIAPIAGTAPLTAESSTTLIQQLRDNEKERAEHLMLVDLARNDIGVVCKPGSVQVADLMTGLQLTHLVHLVSYVTGELATEFDAFDLLKATFPAGTLSGAPKIRAMAIIDELENSKRHLYGGAICKIDNAGNLDSCIAIRGGIIRDGVVHIRAGCGVVFDSDPQQEAEETRHKAKGVLQAIALAERGAS